MPQKSKYTVEEKVRLVCDYIAGELSTSEFENRYGVKKQLLKDWVRLYKVRGVEGLTPAIRTRKYSQETKCSAVQDYLNGVGSLYDICTKYDISTRKILRQWIKKYNNHEDFQPNNGGVAYMVKGRKTTQEERIEIVS